VNRKFVSSPDSDQFDFGSAPAQRPLSTHVSHPSSGIRGAVADRCPPLQRDDSELVPKESVQRSATNEPHAASASLQEPHALSSPHDAGRTKQPIVEVSAPAGQNVDIDLMLRELVQLFAAFRLQTVPPAHPAAAHKLTSIH